jgi:Leucine-rich repeat (LRR) protein
MKNLELLGIVVVKPYAALQYFQKLPKLKYLHLGFGDAASEELAPLQFLNHLEHLELFVHDGTPENSETLDGMLKFLTNMPRLQYLYVRGENFSGKGLIHLEKLPELQVLEIYCHDKILDDELDHLANLPKLKSLTIADSKLTDRSLERLKGLTRLEGLELHSELLTSEGIAELSKSLPKTNINDGSKYCGFGEEAY